jgi:hypothetical protein
LENNFKIKEEDMPDAMRGIFGRISHWIAARRRFSDFSCGDCDRAYRCNLSPSDDCIARQEQIARGYWKAKRRDRALLRQSHLI